MTATRQAPHKCGGCDSRWSGSNIAHCAACHETFTTPNNFDRHRAGSKDRSFMQGQCSTPSLRGLVRNAHGHWSQPQTEGR